MKRNFAQSPFANVLLFSTFWAIQVFVSKLAFNAGAPVVPFTVQSLVISILLLGLYILAFKREKLFLIPTSILGGLLIASAIHGGIGGLLSNAGVSLTSAINAGFLLQFTTVTTSVLAWLIIKEKMTASKALTIAFIMLGTFFLVTKGHLSAPRIGDLLIILACLAWSTGNVLTRKILKNNKVDADVVSLFRPIAGLPIILASVVAAPLYPQQLQPAFQTNLLDTTFLGYATINAIFAILLWIFLNRTLQIASASYMTMMSSLTPVLVAILALAFLHESLAPIQWVGALLVMSSSFATYLLRIDKH